MAHADAPAVRTAALHALSLHARGNEAKVAARRKQVIPLLQKALDDTAMELGYNHPMGPLKLTDLVGLDVRLNIAEYLHRELGSEAFRPPEVLRRLVSEGKLGKKTGQGFYDWR